MIRWLFVMALVAVGPAWAADCKKGNPEYPACLLSDDGTLPPPKPGTRPVPGTQNNIKPARDRVRLPARPWSTAAAALWTAS